MVFRVWLHISVEGCNMAAATSVLPWNTTEAVVDVSVAGVEIQMMWRQQEIERMRVWRKQS